MYGVRRVLRLEYWDVIIYFILPIQAIYSCILCSILMYCICTQFERSTKFGAHHGCKGMQHDWWVVKFIIQCIRKIVLAIFIAVMLLYICVCIEAWSSSTFAMMVVLGLSHTDMDSSSVQRHDTVVLFEEMTMLWIRSISVAMWVKSVDIPEVVEVASSQPWDFGDFRKLCVRFSVCMGGQKMGRGGWTNLSPWGYGLFSWYEGKWKLFGRCFAVRFVYNWYKSISSIRW